MVIIIHYHLLEVFGMSELTNKRQYLDIFYQKYNILLTFRSLFVAFYCQFTRRRFASQCSIILTSLRCKSNLDKGCFDVKIVSAVSLKYMTGKLLYKVLGGLFSRNQLWEIQSLVIILL